MVAVPGQFDSDDAAPDPVAMERLTMFANLTGCSAGLQLAATQLRRLIQQDRLLGNIGDDAAELATIHADSVDHLARVLNDTAAIYRE